MTHNYWANSNLPVGDKWASFLIEMLAENRVLGNKNYKASAALRKKMMWKKFIYFNKRMLCHPISFCFS